MTKMESLRKRCWQIVYLLSVAAFLTGVAGFYKRGYGFTSLIEFGDQFGTRGIAGLHCFVEPHSSGYDGQFYAKLSLDPLLLHPGNDERVVDDLYYRSRRISLSWSAWILGLGRPAWIMQAFALQNVACWLLLALLLTRWFPPLDFNNYARWAGILFSGGWMQSVRSSLTDGPGLLMIAIGLALYERNRATWASGIFAIAGLARETSLLAFAALADPAKRNLRDLRKLVLLGLLAAAPLVCWMIYLKLHLTNPAGITGTRNIGLPFVGWIGKWKELLPLVRTNRWALQTLLVQLALAVQVIYLFARPVVSKPAWRMGIAFAVLTICLGSAVWEGIPGASARTVLPMLLAFNLLVPRGRWWLPLLLAGNLSVAIQPLYEFPMAGDVGVVNVSAPGLAADGKEITFEFSPEWYPGEHGLFQTWRRWSPGAATVTIQNAHAFAVEADVSMNLSARKDDNRPVSVELNGREIWSGTLTGNMTFVQARSLRLEPGANLLVFKTEAVVPQAGSHSRNLAFCLRDLNVDVLAAAKP